MPGKVFISYRRSDDPAFAARVRDALVTKFGRGSVFMDVDNLLAGQKFDRELAAALQECDVLIAIMGAQWMPLLREREASGERDYIREEISGALNRNITVIPVRVGLEGRLAALPRAFDLPEDIKELVAHQKLDITHEQFAANVNNLVSAIQIQRRRLSATRPRIGWPVKTGFAVAATGCLALIAYVINRDRPDIATTPAAIPQAPPGPDRAALVDEHQRKLAEVEAASRKASEEAAARLESERQARSKAEAEAQRLAEAARNREEEIKVAAAETARRAEEATEVTDRVLLQELQERLYELNYDPGERDGNKSPALEQSIREFQIKAGLAQTGRTTKGLLFQLQTVASLSPWGAIVFAETTQKWGMAWQHSTRAGAVSAARASCGSTPSSCSVVLTFFGKECGAFAYSERRWSLAARESIPEAHAAAQAQCQRSGETCRIVAEVCADGREKSIR